MLNVSCALRFHSLQNICDLYQGKYPMSLVKKKTLPPPKKSANMYPLVRIELEIS